ncbi:putative TrkA-N domain dehydrogenase [Seiridium unicorne]|uniref:TrkA-N domain dehydrogenase n=1 Tax=Seiridium unicorne TaxID=138068 RepID=A0ABR2V318_9PEZI
MHFLMIGGSGRTGQLIIDEALVRGHQVTALVRKSSSLAPRNNLTTVEGTPTKPEDIDRAFEADASSTPTAVVVALNARRTSDSPFAAPSPDTPPRMMADSVANAITAMKKYGARKIVINSSMGAGSSIDGLNCLLRPVFLYSNMRFQMDDHNAVDEETRKAGVDFVLVRPAMLAEGAPAEVKVYGDDGKGSGFMPKITRESVARFMVVEALEGHEYDGRAPVITN